MTTDSGVSESSVPGRVTFPLIAICFLLSGFAALLYEIVWLRQFAIILGTSEQALAVILASYMGGLSIGSWVAGRRVDHVRYPVWLYGLLEAGIAVCAIAMPWGLRSVEYLQVQLFGGAAEPPAAGSFSQTMFGLASAFTLILLPTAMMGATLPLLAKHVVHRNREVGPRIGVLYGINTFGAVAGTLAAAFVFLPNLGLKRTTWVGAAINFAIFALVWLLARRIAVTSGASSTTIERSGEGRSKSSNEPSRYRLVLCFAALAGAVAFCYEIIFTRMLSHILGGSIYAFATMLAGFLLGIALGGTIASRLAIRRDRSVVALVYAQCLAGLCALSTYHLIDAVAGWSFTDWGGTSAMFSQVAVSILILLPTATCLGATFPLATRIFAHDQMDAAASAAKVYFWNTVGGIVGALLTGIVILPFYAYHGSTSVAILLNAGAAIALVLVMRAKLVHLAAGVLTLILLACWMPGIPDRVMRISALSGQQTRGELIFSSVGRSGTVTLFEQQGDVWFLTNGLPEAFVRSQGSSDPYADSEAWLGALPPLLRSTCDSMLIIGLGGGVAAAHVPPSVQEIDVFELEPAVVDANLFIRTLRERDPLADSRVKVILNDGRNGLALTSKKYDAIVSQPSHPWTAGASHLYTREFAETVHGRLKSDGIFLQWMNIKFVNPELFGSLAATLLDVFPHVRVYEPFPDNCLLVASAAPIRPEAVSQPALDVDPRNLAFYQEFGVQNPTHLLALLRIDEPELRAIANDADLITDESNLLAMQAPSLLSDEDAKESMKAFLNAHSIYRQSSTRIRENCPTLNPIAFAMRLQLKRGVTLDIQQTGELIGNNSETFLYRALIARIDGQTEQWADLLRKAADRRPRDPRPAFLLLAHSRLGMYESLAELEAAELTSHLDERYKQLLTAVDALSRNDFDTMWQNDSQLASFSIDEVGYELAVRMRILWRIADTGSSRQLHNRQALQLISQTVPFQGEDALILFRVAAAMGADQPEAALACSVHYAKSVVDRIKSGEETQVSRLESLRTNVIKCHSIIANRQLFESVSKQRYSSALDYLNRVISGDI